MADVEAERNAALPANMLPSEAHGGRDEVPVGILIRLVTQGPIPFREGIGFGVTLLLRG